MTGTEGEAVEYDACRLDQLIDGRGYPVRVRGRYLAVFLDGADVHVVDNQCSHTESPLDGGAVCDGRLQCPWHGWVYDLRTGEHLTAFGPRDGVRTYRTRVVDGMVKVSLPDRVGD